MHSQTDGRSGYQSAVCASRRAAHSGRTGLADARARLGTVAQHSAAWRGTRQQGAGARQLCAGARRQCTELADEGSYTRAVTDGF
ncbi:UNVERIFIED_CONTAM: hypothetical protein Sangu_2579300 [Sesamum angustifolium]|uniref:Uncharacterized protein n=1 Tax=Sesamum angustifolium TaxID=2727405 RepID=A0AAW2J7M5_9LAMI